MLHIIKFIDRFSYLLHSRLLVAIILFVFTNLRRSYTSFLLLFLRVSGFREEKEWYCHSSFALRILLRKRMVKTISIDFALEDIT